MSRLYNKRGLIAVPIYKTIANYVTVSDFIFDGTERSIDIFARGVCPVNAKYILAEIGIRCPTAGAGFGLRADYGDYQFTNFTVTLANQVQIWQGLLLVDAGKIWYKSMGYTMDILNLKFHTYYY